MKTIDLEDELYASKMTRKERRNTCGTLNFGWNALYATPISITSSFLINSLAGGIAGIATAVGVYTGSIIWSYLKTRKNKAKVISKYGFTGLEKKIKN